MFELYYPGKCFGNIDVLAKECKKCKIKQFCKTPAKGNTEDAGLSHFKNLLLDKYVCEFETKSDRTHLTCFEKITQERRLDIDFVDNGHIMIKCGEKEIDVTYIVSKEKADKLFLSLTA